MQVKCPKCGYEDRLEKFVASEIAEMISALDIESLIGNLARKTRDFGKKVIVRIKNRRRWDDGTESK